MKVYFVTYFAPSPSISVTDESVANSNDILGVKDDWLIISFKKESPTIMLQGRKTYSKSDSTVISGQNMSLSRLPERLLTRVSLRVSSNESENVDELIMKYAGQVPHWQKHTRVLVGLFDESVRENFFCVVVAQEYLFIASDGKRSHVAAKFSESSISRVPTVDDLLDRGTALPICQKFYGLVEEPVEESERIPIALNMITKAEPHYGFDYPERFLCNYTALEVLCSQVRLTNSEKKARLRLFDAAMESLGASSESSDARDLLIGLRSGLNHLPVKWKFKTYAEARGLPNYENDVSCFSDLTLMRNSLVHDGIDKIQPEDVFKIEAIAKRYMQYELVCVLEKVRARMTLADDGAPQTH